MKKKEPKTKYYTNRKCVDCGSKNNVQKIPHPYESELRGDHTLVFICDTCAHEASQNL